MRRFSLRPLFGFIALIGLSLAPIPAFAQRGGGGGGHSGGGSHGSSGGGGFHGGTSSGGFHGGAPGGAGAPHGSAGAPRGGYGAGHSPGTGGAAGAGRGIGSSRSMSSESHSHAGSSNIRPAINDGQWHSFGNAGNSTRAASARPANSLVARSTGFSGGRRSFGGEPRFGVGGGFRGGWGGGWRGGCCWGGGFGFGFGWGYGWGWPYWGPAWAFGWDPFWYPPYWYSPYGYGAGYGYYSDSSYNSDASYNTPPYRSEVLSEYDKDDDSPTAYLNRPTDDGNDDNTQAPQPEATPSGQVPVAAQTSPSLLEN